MWFYKCVVCCEYRIEYRSFAPAEKALSEVFTHRATDKITEFTQKFIEMKRTLDTGITINTAIVLKRTLEKVDSIGSSSSALVFFYFPDIRISRERADLVEAPTCKYETVCPPGVSSRDQG
jgi:hypothetical protein